MLLRMLALSGLGLITSSGSGVAQRTPTPAEQDLGGSWQACFTPDSAALAGPLVPVGLGWPVCGPVEFIPETRCGPQLHYRLVLGYGDLDTPPDSLSKFVPYAALEYPAELRRSPVIRLGGGGQRLLARGNREFCRAIPEAGWLKGTGMKGTGKLEGATLAGQWTLTGLFGAQERAGTFRMTKLP